MSQAEPFPLYFPGDARRPFESEELTRRFARLADLVKGCRVLDLAASPNGASVLLARELGCEVVSVDSDEAVVRQTEERLRTQGLLDRISVKKVTWSALPFGDGEFDGIFAQGRVVYRLSEAGERLRRLLAPRGRLVLTYPARVGRFQPKVVLEHWEKRLGEALRLPRELLQDLERCGFEPEGVETLGDAELAELYRSWESRLGQQKDTGREAEIKEEIDLFRSSANRSVFTYALIIGRRKEPGEKPPVSRDRG